MNRADKVERIRRVLDELYVDPPIPLDHRDPFTLLVAVVLSAQTTDARVNMVTPELFRRAPTPAAMARLEVAEILEIVKTCGLAPAKAKNVSGLAKILVAKHGGQVPRTFEELEALPGVGHKTASVVMAQAFGVPAFPVDTHIHRLAERWGLSDGSSVEQTERDLKAAFPIETWIAMHLKIILFGREHCPALRHDMSACPICSFAATAARIKASQPVSAVSSRRPSSRPPSSPRAKSPRSTPGLERGAAGRTSKGPTEDRASSVNAKPRRRKA